MLEVDVPDSLAIVENTAGDHEHRERSPERDVAMYLCSHLVFPPFAVVLDNACGAAIVTDEVMDAHPSASIHAVDASPGGIEKVKLMITQRGWEETVVAKVMDGQHMDFDDGYFDISITNFGPYVFTNPKTGVKEIHRTLKKGGIAVFTCWKEFGLVSLFYKCQNMIEPVKRVTSLPVSKTSARKETMERVLKNAVYADVRFEIKEVISGYHCPARLLQVVWEKFKVTIEHKWSIEETARLYEAAKKLLEDRKEEYFVENDGRIGVRMVAVRPFLQACLFVRSLPLFPWRDLRTGLLFFHGATPHLCRAP